MKLIRLTSIYVTEINPDHDSRRRTSINKYMLTVKEFMTLAKLTFEDDVKVIIADRMSIDEKNNQARKNKFSPKIDLKEFLIEDDEEISILQSNYDNGLFSDFSDEFEINGKSYSLDVAFLL